MFWIRLDEPPLPAHEVPVGGWDGISGRLCALLGCRRLWWVPDQETAWAALMEASEVGRAHTVIAPVGVGPVAERAARRFGAAYLEIDVDPVFGQPRWASVPPGSSRRAGVWIVDHRHGLPSPRPPVRPDDLVIEEATAAAGGAVAGRPVGSIGAAAVLSLGAAAFARSTGALIAASREAVAARLAGVVGGGVAPEAMWPALWGDATGAREWVQGCRAAAEVYDSAWRGAKVPVHPVGAVESTHATRSIYLVRVPDPEALIEVLAQAAVEARRPASAALARALTRPEPRYEGARAFYRDLIRLPNHPDLGLGELLYVADAVRSHLQRPRP